MLSRKRALTSSFRSVDAISAPEILAMHKLFTQFYANADAETFLKDLSKKSGAILVHDPESGEIRGFSTVMTMPLWDGEREVLGVFSGDTILDPAYWGDRALKDGFARYLVKLLITKPGTPIYWLLISKGYKTYLLLANNFGNYYPRHDRPNDPKLKRLVEAYCHKMFPGKYDELNGVLDFGNGSQCLKEEVAPITEEAMAAEPAIRYFAERNPEWQRGVELPCVGEVSLSLLWPYLDKQRKKLRRTSAPPPAMTASPRSSGVYASPTVTTLNGSRYEAAEAE